MGKLDDLWEYQTLELEKERLEREILSTPARAKLNKLHGFLTEQQNAISKLQRDMEQKDSELQRLEAKVDEQQRQIDLESSEFGIMLKDEDCTAEEFTESRQSYERLQSLFGATRRELSELVKWFDQAANEYKATRQRAGRAKKEYDAMRLVCEQEIAAQKGPVEAAAARLAEQESKVEPALLSAYRRVKKNHAVPMARVENDQCGGCNMSLPMVVVKRVANNVSVVECENCGRILYASEG